MSDTIKQQYNEYEKSIMPSAEFQEKLIEQLKAEQTKKRAPKYMGFVYAAAAAAAVICIGAVALNINDKSKTPAVSAPVSDYAAESGNAAAGNSFTFRSWDSELSGMAANEALAEKLKSVEKLYSNTENRFSDENIIGGNEEELAKKIRSAKPADIGISGETVYYMAVFSDGTVAKFTVTDGKYLTVSEKIYIF